MRKYRLVAKKGEGTFSEVLKAQNVKDGKYHAIKCMKNRFESIDQVNNLREIQALRRLSPHEHIISLEEVLYDQPTGRLALVFELMDANLYELIRGRKHYLNPQLIKSYMWQLMKSLEHMHKKGIFHRDIKPENILIESSTEIGRGLKLADFGSCRGIYSKQPYTEYISTRWYRAPECLLTDGYYGPEMDLWGAGCVMFEITSLYPLFPGTNEVDQISRIHKVLGTPSEEILQKFRSKGASHISFDFPLQKGIGIPQLITHAPADCIDLIEKMLKYDASERITSREAMRHPYFKDVREAEAKRTSTNPGTGASDAKSSTGPAAIGGSDGKGGKTIDAIPVTQTQTQSKAHLATVDLKTPANAGVAKGLPNILGPSPSGDTGPPKPAQAGIYTSSNDLHAQNSQLSFKMSGNNKGNSIPIAQTALSSLPPIGGLPPVGQGQSQNMAARSGAGATGGVGSTANSVASSQAKDAQKRRKKYRMNGGQQQMQPMQPSQQIQPIQVQQSQFQQMAKRSAAATGGGGMGGTSNTNATAGAQQGGSGNSQMINKAYGVPRAGGSVVMDSGASVGGGASVKASGGAADSKGGANAYGAHPGRYYVPKKG